MHETLPQIIFYVFAGLTVLSSLLVITQNNPVRCVLFLVLAFFASSVLWLLVKAEFLALILVLVYVGAVMTLFLFVVMMLNIDAESKRHHFLRYIPMVILLTGLLVGLLYFVMPAHLFNTGISPAAVVVAGVHIADTESLGLVLYTQYVLAFEMAAVILLMAIIAAITLVHRRPTNAKLQNIVAQLKTRKADRVQLVKMQTEGEV